MSAVRSIRSYSCSGNHAEDATTSVQGTAFRTRDHHAVRATVSPAFTELSKLGRAHGRTQSRRRSRYHLALGAALRTRTGSPLPPGASHDESVVECDETLMFASPAGGPIYIGRSIPPGTPSIFCSRRIAMHRQPNASFTRHCAR